MNTKAKVLLIDMDEAEAKQDLADITKAIELYQSRTQEEEQIKFQINTFVSSTLELRNILQGFVDSQYYRQYDPGDKNK